MIKKRLLGKIRSKLCPPRRGYLDAPELKPDDVFLVSYPRSGNTWMRNIIAHLLYSHDRIHSLRDLDYLVPDIHRGISKHNQYSTPRVIKTHRSFPLRHERRNEALYSRNIYLVRHPFDVIRSFYHYQTHLWSRTYSLEEFVYKLLNGALEFGSWQEHVLSWKAMGAEREIIFIRYEDLSLNFASTIAKVADFLDIQLSERSASLIKSECSLESMLELEKKGSLVDDKYPFVRREENKRVLEQDLSHEMKELIACYSSRAMELFGYSMDHN